MSEENEDVKEVIILGKIPVEFDVSEYFDDNGSPKTLGSEPPMPKIHINTSYLSDDERNLFSKDDGGRRNERQKDFRQKPFRRPPHEFSDHRRRRR